MKISIIILNYQQSRNLIECLESVNSLKTSGYEVQLFVVDNGSKEKETQFLKQHLEKRPMKFGTTLIESKINLGFSEGNNAGIIRALENQSKYIMLLNNDTLVEKSLLIQLIKVMEKDKKIGIASPKIFFAPGFEFHQSRYQKKELGKVIWYAGGRLDWQNVLASHQKVDEVDKGQNNEIKETDFATGCCMLVKKDVFEKIGLLDKKYFLYWEDIDLCQRAKKAGFKIIYAPQAFLWHKNAGASEGAGGKTAVYYQTRNRLLFGFRYAGWRTKAALLKEAVVFLLKGSKWQKKGIRDFFSGRFGQQKI